MLAEGVAPLAGECGKCLSWCPVCPPPFTRRWRDLAPMKLPRVRPASARTHRNHSVMPDIHDFPGTPSPDRPCEGTAASKHQHRRAMLPALANSHRASLSTFRLRIAKSGGCQGATFRFLPIAAPDRPTIDTNRATAPCFPHLAGTRRSATVAQQKYRVKRRRSTASRTGPLSKLRLR